MIFKKRRIIPALFVIFAFWLVIDAISLYWASQQKVDAYFVLGGSNTREIHCADLVAKHPEIPALISSGSPDPCIYNAFTRAEAPMDKVWLQKCAGSTFDNMYYGLPFFKNLKARHVVVITSSNHLPRAKWLAQIILGAHGIWTDFDILEDGIPAKPEYEVKTWLDVIRSFGWALFSQFYSPDCTNVILLSTVDMNYWNQVGYECAHHINPKTGRIENDSVKPSAKQ